MTCSKNVFIPEGSTANYQLIRCCPEITKCDGEAGGVAGDCETVDAATARFYLKNQTHSVAMTALTDYQVVPVIQGTVGVADAVVTVAVTLADGTTVMTFETTADSNGEWYLDLSEAEDTSAAMLPVDTFSDGDALLIDISATVGSCGVINRQLTGTYSVADTSC